MGGVLIKKKTAFVFTGLENLEGSPCTLSIVLLRGSRIGMGFLRPDEF